MKKALLYYRVSTETQASQGTGLERQRQECLAYAGKIGYEVFAEIVEQISGTVSIFERNEGKKIRELVEKKKIDALILEKMNRLVRGDNSRNEYLELKIFCAKHGIELHFTSTGRDEDSMVNNIIQIINAQTAGDDWSNIRKQMRMGRELKAQKEKKWVGTATPYGYKKIGKQKETYLEIDNFEAAIIQRIFMEYSGLGYNRPFTMREIMRGLTDDAIPAPRGKNWHAETIMRILQQRDYLGEFSYSGNIIDLPDLAIIDPEVWNAAQERRIRNKELYFRNPHNQYMLSGFLRCSCGAAFTGSFSTKSKGGKIILRYQCSKGKNPYKQLFSNCKEPLLPLKLVDDIVWNWIEKICLDEEGLDEGLRLMMDQSEDELTPKRRRLAELREVLVLQRKVQKAW